MKCLFHVHLRYHSERKKEHLKLNCVSVNDIVSRIRPTKNDILIIIMKKKKKAHLKLKMFSNFIGTKLKIKKKH